MIKVDEAVLKKAELLSKLKIADSERERTRKEMEKLLIYAERLNEVDTEGILPLSHGESAEYNLREDAVTGTDGRVSALANAPKHEEVYFIVPKTV